MTRTNLNSLADSFLRFRSDGLSWKRAGTGDRVLLWGSELCGVGICVLGSASTRSCGTDGCRGEYGFCAADGGAVGAKLILRESGGEEISGKANRLRLWTACSRSASKPWLRDCSIGFYG
jgi:hypothetical protein